MTRTCNRIRTLLPALLILCTLFLLIFGLRVPANAITTETRTTGSCTQSGNWQWPVSSARISQSFGHYSSSMAKKCRPYHCGMDLVSSNRTIRAAADGTVVYRGYTSGNGNHVIIRHTVRGKTIYTLYSHLSNFNNCPKVNRSVSKGQKIGTMGNTGNSTGTHLHFAVFSGYSSDPYGYAANMGSGKITYKGCTYYDPSYVIANGRLP